MTVGELMIRKFETVRADAGLEEVARKLEASGMSLLPVTRDGLLVGMITHEQVAVGVPGARRRLEPTRVADLIAPDLLFCYETTDVKEAAKLMRENRVSLLPVLGPGKRIVGVLSLESIPGSHPPQEKL